MLRVKWWEQYDSYYCQIFWLGFLYSYIPTCLIKIIFRWLGLASDEPMGLWDSSVQLQPRRQEWNPSPYVLWKTALTQLASRCWPWTVCTNIRLSMRSFTSARSKLKSILKIGKMENIWTYMKIYEIEYNMHSKIIQSNRSYQKCSGMYCKSITVPLYCSLLFAISAHAKGVCTAGWDLLALRNFELQGSRSILMTRPNKQLPQRRSVCKEQACIEYWIP